MSSSSSSSSSSSVSSLAIIGDGSVGKSSLIAAFTNDGFMPVYRQTIGCDFYEKTLSIRGDRSVSLRVWDIGGQSIHSKSLSEYLGSSSIIYMVYDVTNYESFGNMEDWLVKLKLYARTDVLIYLVGNKIDLISLRQVTERQHDAFIEEHRLSGGMYMSAKTGENVVKMFYKTAAESVGIHLSSYELAFHDTVVTAYVTKDDNNEGGRTAWADEIEAADLEAERRKQEESEGCKCSLQ
jgi:Ras-related protein Rab-28